jgi:hypothetical protein
MQTGPISLQEQQIAEQMTHLWVILRKSPLSISTTGMYQRMPVGLAPTRGVLLPALSPSAPPAHCVVDDDSRAMTSRTSLCDPMELNA